MPATYEHERSRRADPEVADAEIIRRLVQEGFDPAGPTWQALTKVLIDYGYSVLTSWFVTGTIHRQAARQGRSGVLGLSRIPRDLRLPADDAHELTANLLAVAVKRFRVTLQDGLWQQQGGASLRTYFIGRCLMELPDVYERWRREQDRWAAEVHDRDMSTLDDGRFSADPADLAIATVQLDELLPPEEYEHVRVMIQLSQFGYTAAEIAEEFTKAGMPYTEATVRTRISRARSRVRARHDRHQRGDSDER